MTSFKIKNLKIAGVATGLLLVGACTNLDEKVYDRIPAEEYGKNQDQVNSTIGPLYGALGDYYGLFAGLNAVTDEQIVPTRGGDWKDGDQWKRLELHTWSSSLDDGTFNGIWTWAYTNIARVNQFLNDPSFTDPGARAQLRTVRAFYHYVAMDNFGNIVIDDGSASAESGSLSQSTRAQVYAFIEKELTESLPDLSEDVGGVYYGRMNKWVARMILAKLYLNHAVYLGSATTATYQKAWDQCDLIIKSGKFQINNDFFSNFSVTNEGSPEIILATPMDKTKRTGFNTQFSTLHYLHQLTYDLGAAPWNGYSTAAEFYNTFEDGDVRKNMWIVGQQYDIAGKELMDDNVPMIIDPVIPQFEMPAGAVGRLKGARSQKYEIQLHNKTSGNSQDNDFIIYRLADVYLMRGEASFRLGDPAAAADDFNEIRSKRGASLALFDASITEADMLAERGRELAWEFHRRQDMIRFGTFDDAFGFKPATDAHTNLFPIPQSQINLNPNLKQNPGY